MTASSRRTPGPPTSRCPGSTFRPRSTSATGWSTPTSEAAGAGKLGGLEAVIAMPDAAGTPFVSLAELSAGAAPLDDARPVPADALALIWHTGGTTGIPKACYHQVGRFLAGGYAAARAF